MMARNTRWRRVLVALVLLMLILTAEGVVHFSSHDFFPPPFPFI